MSVEQDIKQKALELGFDAAGITDASPIGREHVEHFEAWLRSGYAGPMQYMHRNLEKRIDPSKLLNGAKSVIVVALNYKPLDTGRLYQNGELLQQGGDLGCHGQTLFDCALSSDSAHPKDTAKPVWPWHPTPQIRMDSVAGWAPLTTATSSTEPIGRIAQYAQYEDYHGFIKSLLRELADFIQLRMGGPHRYKLCVDSAPVAEKALAVRAGLGFIGKNHLLIHPRLGPQILLGELITTASLQPGEPCTGGCGGCDLCLRACPTGALRSDGLLDARECISCLTQYGSSPKIGDWLFGCDECLLACPHQQRAPVCANHQFKRCPERTQLGLRGLLELTPEAFDARFHDSPVGKVGLDALKRNAEVCLKNRR